MQPVPSARITLAVIVVLASSSAAASAQLITLKTVPVAAGDQFLIFPSENLAMGAVSIALEDPLLDPFVNPGTGVRVAPSIFLAAPTFYSISNNNGSARTVPAGGLFSSNGWFGGGLVALQQLQRGEEVFPVRGWLDASILPPNALSGRSATNKYAFGTLGRSLPGGWAIGASALLSDLGAVDGVEQLYALSADIDQTGNMEDLRVGVTGDLTGDRKFEALILHNRFNMTHDVSYVDVVLVDSTNWIWEDRVRVEHNQDQTRTWGLHLGYHQPLGETGWRIGGIFTGNRKSHPKIPNYELMNIPRDPGTSWAYNFGIGVSRSIGPTKFGLDVVYEPAWSDTWAEAEAPVGTASGDTIAAGGKTVENSFTFSNAAVRMGLAQEVGIAVFQLGLQVLAYDYHLDQWDNVAETSRRQDEQWMEWIPSWGIRLRFADLELRYIGRATTGTGRPGTAWNGVVAARADALSAANDIVVAPNAPLTLQDATVVTHQISVSLPIK